ncbi:MAG: DUF6106 family protein [Butyrivibrio hungatei]|jgi:hypothetical protein|nr:DUF6106 family protein [Butyrivibrio hungatei]
MIGNDNSYVECLVASKASPLVVILKYVSFGLAIFFLLSTLLLNANIICLLLFIAAVAGYYFAKQNADIEYEYQYCDKEISIDKILNKSSRKHIGTYEVEKIAVMAPSGSYHLSDYKNQTFKTLDFSAKNKNAQPDPTYTFYYDGKEKIVFEPNSEMVAAIKAVAPRKVFTD